MFLKFLNVIQDTIWMCDVPFLPGMFRLFHLELLGAAGLDVFLQKPASCEVRKKLFHTEGEVNKETSSLQRLDRKL